MLHLLDRSLPVRVDSNCKNAYNLILPSRSSNLRLQLQTSSLSLSLSPRNQETRSTHFLFLFSDRYLRSLMAKRRRTEIAFIAAPASRLVTYSKRRKGLFNKASELCRLCGARAAVVVFSPAGKPCSFGDPSADDIVSDYLRVCDGDVMPPMDLTEWEKRVDTELDACATEEELEYFISKYEAVRDCARQKLKALEEEEDSQAKDGGAGDSKVLTEEKIDAIYESLARCLARPDLTDGDHYSVMTSPENSAAGGGSSAVESARAGGSSAVESDPARSDLKGCGANAAGSGSLGMASTPTCSDLEDCGFDPDELLTLLDNCVVDGDGNGFLNRPEDSAVGGGNWGMEATRSDQEGYGYYNPNDFVDLEDLDVQLLKANCYAILLDRIQLQQ